MGATGSGWSNEDLFGKDSTLGRYGVPIIGGLGAAAFGAPTLTSMALAGMLMPKEKSAAETYNESIQGLQQDNLSELKRLATGQLSDEQVNPLQKKYAEMADVSNQITGGQFQTAGMMGGSNWANYAGKQQAGIAGEYANVLADMSQKQKMAALGQIYQFKPQQTTPSWMQGLQGMQQLGNLFGG